MCCCVQYTTGAFCTLYFVVKVSDKCLHDGRTNIQENIDMIRLQRELHEKSSRLTQVQQNFSNLQEVKAAPFVSFVCRQLTDTDA